ncbi:MAG TPA: ABC transporter ATP-binding protein [Chitinophagales bacterium]|nr:ABC transporter ATP-binding protein [Chitinophagales bacterium]
MAYILEAENLTKHYGRVKALTNFSLTVEPGSICGILGPNGSGKTTCLGIMLGAIKADNGSYEWFGKPASHHTRRRRIGALLESPNFYPHLSGVENLRVVAAIKNRGSKNIHTALQTTGLTSRRNSLYRTYSLGMKQRLAIASTLIVNPEALVLDEPTNGLDPQGIAEIRTLITEIGREGKTIILASHLLDEVEKVCTHVVILKAGDTIASGRVSDILGKDNQVEVASENMEALESAAKEISGLQSCKKEKDKLVLKFHTNVNTAELNGYFFDKGITLSHLVTKRKSLENLFLELTSSHA